MDKVVMQWRSGHQRSSIHRHNPPPLACDASGCAQAASGEASVMLHGLSKSETNLIHDRMGQSSCDTETSVATDKISEFAAQVELQNDLNQAVLPTCLDSGRSEEAHRTSPVVTTSEPTLEKEAKIQSSLASTDPVGVTSDHGEQPDKIVHVFNEEEIEGLDWSDAKLREQIHVYLDKLNFSLPDEDDEFWSLYDDQELKKLNERLALHRVRAHKISEGALLEELDDEKLIQEYPPAILEDEEYFQWYEKDFEWYFDPNCCRFVGFQDYQRLVLRDDRQYLRWGEYHKTYMTYQGDQEYVKFYETVSRETKWLENFVDASMDEWLRYETLAMYKAMKIAAGCNNILPTLIHTGFNEYLWDVKCNGTYDDYASLYLEIWKRVAKEKMSFLSAVKEIHDQDMCSPCLIQMKIELGCAPTSGGLRTNYDRYLADLDGEVEQNEAHSIILEAVKKFVPKQKSYYDYVIKKLDIARKNGVIPL
ncbi:hypothetical protein BDA96_02G227300 [Sorghum bicolor]|uniref:Uncharacterized protein n=1 Tax=Sorghum bicolor TaxID=4558 RepID=A0A921UTR5_SORBI|nr:hypothetical protein BDA96_02G227300 [Sorghum bicolor]